MLPERKDRAYVGIVGPVLAERVDVDSSQEDFATEGVFDASAVLGVEFGVQGAQGARNDTR